MSLVSGIFNVSISLTWTEKVWLLHYYREMTLTYWKTLKKKSICIVNRLDLQLVLTGVHLEYLHWLKNMFWLKSVCTEVYCVFESLLPPMVPCLSMKYTLFEMFYMNRFNSRKNMRWSKVENEGCEESFIETPPCYTLSLRLLREASPWWTCWTQVVNASSSVIKRSAWICFGPIQYNIVYSDANERRTVQPGSDNVEGKRDVTVFPLQAWKTAHAENM